ncbi:M56 family metallopeptidase [Prauserella oleivorans]|uniref:M56 family metallopeptidase n=1 Tax=Prauserella oleivorans TaxID=1478153 RepID=A0ABW5WCW6_9PSEU
MPARGGAFWVLIGVGAILRASATIGSCAVATAIVHTLWTDGAGRLVATWYLVLPAFALVVLNGIGLLGELKLCGVAVRVNRRLRRSALPAPARVRSVGQRLGLITTVERAPDDHVFALTYGLWRPRIVLSDGLLARCSDDELAAVLEHEAEHVRARDPLRILLSRFAVLRSPFMPALAHLAQRARCDAELAADRRAACRVGPAVLARALLVASAPPPPLAGGVAAGFGDRDIFEARVQQLEGVRPVWGRPTRRAVAISAGGVLLISWFVVAASLTASLLHPYCG